MELQQDSRLIVSASPHIRSQETVSSIMWTVVAALVPAALFSIWHFGAAAAATYLFCIAGSVGCEYLIQKFRGIEITVDDGSAFLTGMLLAMSIPPIARPNIHPVPARRASRATSPKTSPAAATAAAGPTARYQ